MTPEPVTVDAAPPVFVAERVTALVPALMAAFTATEPPLARALILTGQGKLAALTTVIGAL
jgi:hypothetical protein